MFTTIKNVFRELDLDEKSPSDSNALKLLVCMVIKLKRKNVWSLNWINLIDTFDDVQFKKFFRLSKNCFNNIFNYYSRLRQLVPKSENGPIGCWLFILFLAQLHLEMLQINLEF